MSPKLHEVCSANYLRHLARTPKAPAGSERLSQNNMFGVRQMRLPHASHDARGRMRLGTAFDLAKLVARVKSVCHATV
jgi:hypothetical protein